MGDVNEHFNDRLAAQHYRLMLATKFVPLFQKRCYEHMSEWVLQCREGQLPPSSSEEEDGGEQEQQQEQ